MSENTDAAALTIKVLADWSTRQVAGLMLNITSELIHTTPIDTGWARSNWVPSIGEPFLGDVGKKGPNDAGPQSDGESALAGYTNFAMGDIFITNNVPYIQVLNAGHSKQAPAGFVEAAVERGLATTDGVQ